MPPTPPPSDAVPPQTERSKKLQERREERSQQELPQAQGDVQAMTTVPLGIMLGEGTKVTIGAQDYEIAPFPISRLAEVGKVLQLCPDVLITAALAAEEGVVDTAIMAEALTRLSALTATKSDNKPVTAEALEYAISSLATQITEEEASAMADLTVLALRRRHPDVTAESLADDLDLETFLRVLCRVFDVNKAMKKRF